MKKIVVVMMVVLVVVSISPLADALTIDVSPDNPTIVDQVEIDVWTWFADTGQGYIDTSYTLTDFNIEIDVLMQDMHGSGLIIMPVATQDGGSVLLEPLPVGI